jgi:hypothetical protein
MNKPIQQGSHSLRANIRINVDELYEVRHWAKQLGVTEAQLLSAVAQVGPLVAVLTQYFKGKSAERVTGTT